MNVLRHAEPYIGTNRNFRMHDGQMFTYTQTRTGLSYFYGKRKVLDDGVSTAPTDL